MFRPSAYLFSLLLLLASWSSSAFVPAAGPTRRASTTSLASTAPSRKNKKQFTFKDLREEIQQKPTKFLADSNSKKKPRYRRSRRKADNPQQEYVYAQQRGETAAQESIPIALAREYGLVNPAAQHCDAVVDTVEPQILGRVRVGEEAKSGSYAYVVNKPAGWSILGGGGATANTNNNKAKQDKKDDINTSEGSSPQKPKSKQNRVTRLEITDLDGSKEVLEYSDADLLAVMTPEEIEEYKAEMEEVYAGKPKVTKRVKVRADDEDEEEDELLSLDELEREEMELLAELTPEELELYLQEGGELPENFKMPNTGDNTEEIRDLVEEEENSMKQSGKEQSTTQAERNKSIDPKTEEVYTKIEARQTSAKSKKASIGTTSRPSVVAWLKNKMAEEGSPMKGGKYWTALAGATEVDDSGIVLICPKQHTENVFVDYLEYVAVVGNDKHLAAKPKGVIHTAKEELTMDILSTVRRGRGEDAVQTVKVTVPEKFSSCSSIVPACQKQFQDGIRGDPAGNPLGRLAHRRLIHCNAVSVSSLLFDESVEAETQEGVLPDDIRILAERRNQHEYKEGSFLGRSALQSNPLTTAYREINGAADGFPGWTVDRYDKWLLVQHDDAMPRGPLPSIHDGNTAGVYYLPANPDRSAMGSSPAGAGSVLTRPRLLEGQPAPDTVSILENGITYHVSLDKDLSTGIFLDQRSQRAWLARNCNEDTHVLNCFAHCGAFSIAAATAGASTTSLDLNKKWLDRVAPQMEANGVDFDVRHDCIYGDCFDWLAKLAKRQEKYDIVILDPPSSSVGGKKKKRWSIKNDMPELVSLASKVVKKGGLLWTTTNSASVTPVKFARLCRRGLEDAGLGSAKLERIQPMPHDFPSIGPQPVKNFVWRLP